MFEALLIKKIHTQICARACVRAHTHTPFLGMLYTFLWSPMDRQDNVICLSLPAFVVYVHLSEVFVAMLLHMCIFVLKCSWEIILLLSVCSQPHVGTKTLAVNKLVIIWLNKMLKLTIRMCLVGVINGGWKTNLFDPPTFWSPTIFHPSNFPSSQPTKALCCVTITIPAFELRPMLHIASPFPLIKILLYCEINIIQVIDENGVTPAGCAVSFINENLSVYLELQGWDSKIRKTIRNGVKFGNEVGNAWNASKH